MDRNIFIGLSFFLYLAVVVVLGVVAYRRTHSINDFVLGGRRLGHWVTALSAGASDMSGWLLLGLPGYAYLAGLEAFWIALGLALGTWLNWRLVALRLRVFSAHFGDALTIPEFLANRFVTARPWLPIVAAAFILFFFLVYTASGLVAAGKLFEAVFGVPYVWAVAIGLFAIVAYTATGGFLAVSWTDALQATLMAFALVLVPALGLAALGGPGAALLRLEALAPTLLDMTRSADGEPLSGLAIASLLAWGLGYFGQPHILARFKAIRSPAALPAAQRIAVSWVVITLVAAVVVGLVGRAYLSPPLADGDAEKVFLELVATLLPAGLAGVCLAAVLAAIMSTADSQLLVSSAAFTEDIYRRLATTPVAGRRLVLIGRAAVLTLAVLAFILALDRDSRVLDLVAYAWAGFGAAFGPTLILALYWPRFTERGAMLAVVTGGVTVVVWHQLTGGMFDLFEIVPGFLLALGAGVAGSLAGPPPPPQVTQTFAEAQRQLSV
jgi:sodium/proline symporter